MAKRASSGLLIRSPSLDRIDRDNDGGGCNDESNLMDDDINEQYEESKNPPSAADTFNNNFAPVS